jgi:hypothetical membrane protein
MSMLTRRRLATTAAVAPPYFIVMATLATLLGPSGYDSGSQTLSELGSSGMPRAWLINLAFGGYAVMVQGLGPLLHRQTGGGWRGRTVWALVCVYGAGGLLAALIPHDHNGSEIASVMSQHAIHGVVARMGFSAIIALSIVVPALIRAETEWRRWRWFSYVVFTSTAVLGWLFQIDAWEGNRGLLQRGFFLTTMAWVFGTALKLRHGSSRVGRPRNLPRKS